MRVKRRLEYVDGIRAILCVWMISFHSFHYLSYMLPYDQLALWVHTNKRALSWVALGYLPVDGFFVLTGFLIAMPMLDRVKHGKPPVAGPAKSSDDNQRERGKLQTRDSGSVEAHSGTMCVGVAANSTLWGSLRWFYYRRLLRMLPPLFATLFLYCGVLFRQGLYPIELLARGDIFDLMRCKWFSEAEFFPSGCESSPSNLLMTNHLLPFGGCMGYTWSLALQFQFYLFFPVLVLWLGMTKRLSWVLAGLFTLGIAVRFFAYFQLQVTNPFGEPLLEGLFLQFFWYSNTISRIGVILIGVALAWLVTMTNFHTHLRRRSWLSTLLLGLGFGVVWLQLYWDQLFSDHPTDLMHTPGFLAVQSRGIHHVLYYVFLLAGGPLSALFWAYLIYIAHWSIGSVGTVINRFTSWSVWKPISRISYFAYLLHPAFIIKLYATLLSPPVLESFVYIVLVVFLVSMSIAYVLHNLVERPIDAFVRQRRRPFYWLSVMLLVYAVLMMVTSIVQHFITYAYVLSCNQPNCFVKAAHGGVVPPDACVDSVR